MLTKNQIQNIIDAEKVVFTTVSQDFQPRSIWVIPSRVLKDKIILSNIQMQKSVDNVRSNSKCFINVYIADKDDLQYKIEGDADILDCGELFEEIKQYEESENLPPELKVNSIIVINIKTFEQSNG